MLRSTPSESSPRVARVSQATGAMPRAAERRFEYRTSARPRGGYTGCPRLSRCPVLAVCLSVPVLVSPVAMPSNHFILCKLIAKFEFKCTCLHRAACCADAVQQSFVSIKPCQSWHLLPVSQVRSNIHAACHAITFHHNMTAWINNF